jgi:hypothetical protein
MLPVNNSASMIHLPDPTQTSEERLWETITMLLLRIVTPLLLPLLFHHPAPAPFQYSNRLP